MAESFHRSMLFAFKAETQSLKLSGVWPHVNGAALLLGLEACRAVFASVQGFPLEFVFTAW